MSSMGFTRSQPSQSRLPSFSGLRSKASSSNNNSGMRAAPQRSGMSFGRRQPSFTREATPVSHALPTDQTGMCLGVIGHVARTNCRAGLKDASGHA